MDVLVVTHKKKMDVLVVTGFPKLFKVLLARRGLVNVFVEEFISICFC